MVTKPVLAVVCQLVQATILQQVVLRKTQARTHGRYFVVAAILQNWLLPSHRRQPWQWPWPNKMPIPAALPQTRSEGEGVKHHGGREDKHPGEHGRRRRASEGSSRGGWSCL
eukprot:CAMPEP_0198578594 /NCGR_PEP_ID=MMETSP1462-20131121/120429_1 /TAXON_ID=1333877 /ORGANISM="Brandtodinium nutriculum, Strain RCC3387" /LENGTH=111 /DNA_ID=CAMNT_0044309897 /DNA_START=402 /DNA_END=737 /DNA_ORIENTATION=-